MLLSSRNSYFPRKYFRVLNWEILCSYKIHHDPNWPVIILFPLVTVNWYMNGYVTQTKPIRNPFWVFYLFGLCFCVCVSVCVYFTETKRSIPLLVWEVITHTIQELFVVIRPSLCHKKKLLSCKRDWSRGKRWWMSYSLILSLPFFSFLINIFFGVHELMKYFSICVSGVWNLRILVSSLFYSSVFFLS